MWSSLSLYHSSARPRSIAPVEEIPEECAATVEVLDGKKKFPKDDLIEHGTISDLMSMEM